MAHEIDLGGTIYISSKKAAEKTKYTQDYIGQLARGGLIEAKRVSGMWYILEESLRAYKDKADQFVPTPPEGFAPARDSEVSVAFDGKDYISANRAAKLTGYHQDYVGQLARSGTIVSRQVGNRWYVDRESIIKHKEEKDALLAAVQVESVGLAKPDAEIVLEPEQTPEIPAETETHFNYVQEEAPLIPAFELEDSEPMPEYPTRISIARPHFDEYVSQMKAESVPAPEAEIPAEVAPEPVTEQFLQSEEIVEPPKEEVAIPIRVMAPEIPEEEIYYDEEVREEVQEILPQPRPRAAQKSSRAAVFAFSTLTVIAALGTFAYMGSSLGFLNFNGVKTGSQTAQSASPSNSVVENDSSRAENIARSLFSREIVYKRQ